MPETLLDSLSGDERTRGDRFVFPEHRRRHLCARAVLRDVLSRYLTRSAAELEFVIGAQGKPRFEHGEEEPDIRFNLSHSEEWAAVAVALGREVGVDIERAHPRVDVVRVARRSFTPQESAAVERAAPAGRRELFLRLWTVKEALLKGMGSGLTMPMHRFQVLLPPRPAEEPVTIRDLAFGRPCDWVARELVMPSGLMGAVAAQDGDWTVRRFDWRPA